jgi:hypothetical protein
MKGMKEIGVEKFAAAAKKTFHIFFARFLRDRRGIEKAS